MKNYEVCLTQATPCGGEKYAQRTVLEIECESPEQYVRDNARFPIHDATVLANGDTVITAVHSGYIDRYQFTEI